MTSTSFNIGLTSEKNSSRVLRPPGGGHSDIFGMRDNENELITPSKRRNFPQSTIGGCFNMDASKDQTKENESATHDKEIIAEEQKSEVDNGIDENKAPGEVELKEPEKKDEQTHAPRRVRVPPGGFSTALW